MSQENVEVVRRLAERINAGDIDGMLHLISPGIEYWTREDEPDAGVFHGHKEFAEFANSWLSAFDEYEVEVYEYIDAGDYVVVPGRARGRGRNSGANVDAHETWVWRIRDGKAVECREYADTAQALKAVGLSESAMSRENVETVNVVVEAWNAGGRSFALAELCDPDVVLESPFSSVVGEPYCGHAGMEQWIRDVDEQFSDWHIDLDDVREIGDQVIAIGTVRGRGRTSGVDVEFPCASVAHFGGEGRITRIRIFRDVREALGAVGLSE